MLNILKKLKFKKDTKEVDKVYEFFANAKAKDRKRAYDRALQSAQKDQLNILKKAANLKG